MRYLNKIVFLNSAHIPYAEVKLDGNVHFIGTQGVGKSTLLRAILFFYNADKLRLGIPKEKKSFDAFYFPYANSYIIYEVMRELPNPRDGCFSVLLMRHSNRTGSLTNTMWYIPSGDASANISVRRFRLLHK